jgi:heme/copper-type cytochrome/quinol oxidase subunit 3
LSRRGGSDLIAGLFGFLFATLLVFALDPTLQDAVRHAATTTPGPTGSLFWLIYYLHGFSVMIELVGMAGLVGSVK